MKLHVVDKKIQCPISRVNLSVKDCKRCSYGVKIEKDFVECEFK